MPSITKETWPIDLCHKFHPEFRLLKAYIPCWPFDALMCSECGETVVDWGRLKSIAWSVLVGWMWNGAVKVRVEDEE